MDSQQPGSALGLGRSLASLARGAAGAVRTALGIGKAPEPWREIPDPFVLGNPITERDQHAFRGRQDVVRQIEDSLLNPQAAPALLLFGPRRMGKTSVLNQLPRLLGAQFSTAVVDCQSSAVVESLASLLGRLSRNLADALKRQQVPVESLDRSQLREESFSLFDEWLDGVEGRLPEGMRALLCLDEYERLQGLFEKDWGVAFFNYLRSLVQNRRRLVLMFTGAHTLDELGPRWIDWVINVRCIRVSFLGRDDLVSLLTKPLPDFPMRYTPEALEMLLSSTNGQPYLAQVTASELVRHLNQQKRLEAAPGDVEEAINKALESGLGYFANLWADAGPKGQEVLLSLLDGRATAGGDPEARRRLREHDVLNDAGRFAVPMVEEWLRKRKAVESNDKER